MAYYLNTPRLLSKIEEIIEGSDREIYLVTPYIQISRSIARALLDADEAGKKITLLFGKEVLEDNEAPFLSELKNLQLFYYRDLHAKCYFNERQMIIGSMNLYAASARNFEMAIALTAREDGEIYHKARNEVLGHIDMSEPIFLRPVDQQKPELPNYTPIDDVGAELNALVLTLRQHRETIITTSIDNIPHIVVRDKPFDNSEIKIAGIVTFCFYTDDEEWFDWVREEIRPKIEARLPDFRIYFSKRWNRFEIYAYPNAQPHPVFGSLRLLEAVTGITDCIRSTAPRS